MVGITARARATRRGRAAADGSRADRPRRPGLGGRDGADASTPVQGPGAWRRLLPAVAADIARPAAADARPSCVGITAPTLVAIGDRDPLVPVGQAWELSRQVRDGRLFVAPDSGHDVLTRRPALALEALRGFYRSTESIADGPSRSPTGGSPMTTLLVLYRRPDGGPEAQATFERRYTEEHLPLVAGTPGLRKTRVGRVVEALGGETDLMLVTLMRFDDREALDAGLASDAMRAAGRNPARDRARDSPRSSCSRTPRRWTPRLPRPVDTV